MPDKEEIQMGAELRRITGKNGTRFSVMSGKVTAVDEDTNECTVELTCRDIETEGVLLNVALENKNGMYFIPAEDADCLVCEVDGDGQLELLKASKYSKIVASAETLIQLNDGSLGGIPIVGKVDDNVKAIKDYIKNVLEPAISSGITAVGAGGAANGATGAANFDAALVGQTITIVDMENTNIKHG